MEAALMEPLHPHAALSTLQLHVPPVISPEPPKPFVWMQKLRLGKVKSIHHISGLELLAPSSGTAPYLSTPNHTSYTQR